MKIRTAIALCVLTLTLGGAGALYFKLGNFFGRFFPGEITSSASAIILGIDGAANLEVARALIQTNATTENTGWFGGKSKTVLLFNGTASYTLDLTQITPAHMQYMSDQAMLKVALPPVKLGLVEPDTASMQVLRDNNFIGVLQNADSNLLERATKTMTPQLRAEASKPDALRFARTQAITAVKSFLETGFQASGRTIIVQPYFAADQPKS